MNNNTEDKKIKTRLAVAKFRAAHKEKLKVMYAKYRASHKEERKRDNRVFYEKNKNVKYQCECGSSCSYFVKSRHMKTKKHLKYIENLKKEEQEANSIFIGDLE